MKVARIDLWRLRIPLRVPFVTALRTVDAVDDVVVAIHADDGRIGWGSAPPATPITGETHASLRSAIVDAIAPRILGGDVTAIDGLAAAVAGALDGNVGAKSAVDVALHDLWAQGLGLPLVRALGGTGRVLESDVTISVGAPDAMADAARAATARGFRALKLKLADGGALDVARVRAVRHAVGDGVALRLDANQAWSAAQAIAAMRTLEADGIAPELLEQPVPASDLDGLRAVARAIRTPVLADEAVFDAAQAAAVLDGGAAALVNIKLVKSAGIAGALRIADVAAARGAACMVGCMLESPVGVTAAAHLACARPDAITRVDLDAPALCTHNPLDGGAVFDGPRITLADAPGLGIRAIHGLEPLAHWP